MQINIRLSTGQGQANVDKSPNFCPVCHTMIVPGELGIGYQHRDAKRIERIFQCPNATCEALFIAQYEALPRAANVPPFFQWTRSVPFEFETAMHSDTIKSVSPDFCAIHTEAEKAEKHGLTLVAGPGYRKALEFLMKDYASAEHPGDKDKIEKMNLAPCITEYIKSEQIKQISKRAVWLGNDATHYVRKWVDKDLEDLKKLIDLTLHWIEVETLSRAIIADMPDGGPASATSV